MGEWQHGLFGCFDNFGMCIITYFVPCYTAGKNAEKNGESCMVYGLLSILGCIGVWSMTKIRGKTRANKGIEGSYTSDCLMSLFCPICALVQEGQELEDVQVASMARE
ncbi:uncharacterized protein [Antedon mediterranea]|uniref:uncharacterized protein n=1 Tax=Antedon mediterranea TaxID=105859 RepID=UPI003AF83A09